MRKPAYLAAALAVATLAICGCGANCPDLPRVVASVDGREITSKDYLTRLHRAAGERMLSGMLEQQLVVAWAKDQGVPVTESQIDKQMDNLKREGQYDQAIKTLGEDGLRAGIEAMQARGNLARKFYKFTSKELRERYEGGRNNYVHPARKRVALIVNPDKKRLAKAEKAIKGGMDFDEAAALYCGRQLGLRGAFETWVFEGDQQLPPSMTASILNAIGKAKVGTVSKTFLLAVPGMPSSYAIAKVVASQPKADLKFEQVKDELLTAAALDKSSDPDFMKRLNERKKKAHVEIDVPEFKGIIQDFEAPPDLAPMLGGAPSRAPAAPSRSAAPPEGQ